MLSALSIPPPYTTPKAQGPNWRHPDEASIPLGFYRRPEFVRPTRADHFRMGKELRAHSARKIADRSAASVSVGIGVPHCDVRLRRVEYNFWVKAGCSVNFGLMVGAAWQPDPSHPGGFQSAPARPLRPCDLCRSPQFVGEAANNALALENSAAARPRLVCNVCGTSIPTVSHCSQQHVGMSIDQRSSFSPYNDLEVGEAATVSGRVQVVIKVVSLHQVNLARPEERQSFRTPAKSAGVSERSMQRAPETPTAQNKRL